MSVLNFRYRERRRTLRVALSVPVVVHGQNQQGEKFCVRAMTRAVNQQGALLVMDEIVVPGQSLLLVNETRAGRLRREWRMSGASAMGVFSLGSSLSIPIQTSGR